MRHLLGFAGVLLFTVLIADNSGAATAESLDAVNSLAQAGKYEEAYQLFQKKPPTTALDLYNLGTLALRSGHIGPAVANLEKADHLGRHDPDIRHNLEIAHSTLIKILGSEDRIDPASTWTEKLADHISLNELRGVLGLVMLMLALLWIRAYLRTRSLKACLLDISALIGASTLLLVTGLYLVERDVNERPPAIVLGRISIRSGPGKDFAELAQIDPGVKVRVLGHASPAPADSENPIVPVLQAAAENHADTPPSGGGTAAAQEPWYQIRYSTDEIGWVQASGVMVID
jgi:hypothetical protein